MLQRALRDRNIDKLADYVNSDLRFQFHKSFLWAMNFLTVCAFTPFMYLVCEGHLQPSRLLVAARVMSDDELAKQFAALELMLGARATLATIVVAYGSLFYLTFNLLFCYPRYHFFVAVLAPLWRRLGLVDKNRVAVNSATQAAKDGAAAAGGKKKPKARWNQTR